MAASLEVGGWRAELEGLLARFGRLFVRAERRQQAGRYLEGLLAPVERKNGWQLAEHLGDARPWRTQRVLSHVLWDEEAARDLCREHAVGRLGAEDAVLVIDETAFVKKGRHSAGVARQYCGTVGKVENCQVGVFLAYGSRKGHALIDRRLYLPEAWAGDAERRRAAKVPEDVPFLTKPEIARGMIARALDAGVPCGWVLGDEGDGADLAYFVVFAPAGSRLLDLARAAGRRWLVEECFEAAKQEVGLADYEVRSWRGWHRHVTLAMLALALLAGLRAGLNRIKGAPEPLASSSCRSASPRSAA